MTKLEAGARRIASLWRSKQRVELGRELLTFQAECKRLGVTFKAEFRKLLPQHHISCAYEFMAEARQVDGIHSRASEARLKSLRKKPVPPKPVKPPAERQVEALVRAEVQRRIDMMLDRLKRDQDFANEVIKARKGVMTAEVYMLILSCLHPDNSASEDKRAAAFIAFSKLKALLLSQQDEPVKVWSAPITPDQVMRMKL